MVKIKTFEFMIHTWAGSAMCHRKEKSREIAVAKYFTDHCKKSDPENLWSPAEIDSKINSFISDKDIVDIKVENYTAHRHNNAGDDTIIAKYTIIYKE